MASSIPEVVPFQAPQGVHLGLSVGLSALFWNLVVFWTTGGGPSWPLAPLALIYAVMMGFWSPWRLRTHQGPLLKFWLWLVTTLLLYAAFALLDGQPWPTTFGLGGVHVLWFAVAFLQGQVTALWAAQLAPRAKLYQLIEGLPSGKALEDRVREFQLDADFSRANEATLSASTAVLAVLAVLLATFSPFGRSGLSAALAGGFLMLCLLVGVLLRVYRQEMGALIYGRRFTLAEKLAPLGWSVVLLVFAGLGAWGLMALGGPWVDWNALLQGRHEPVPTPEAPSVRSDPTLAPAGGGNIKMAVLLALLEVIFRFHNILFVVQLVIRGAVWIAPWLIVAFLLWPLIRWLLSGGSETKGLGRRWWQLLLEQWRAFLALLRNWWRRPFAVETRITDASTAGEWLRSLFRRPAAGRRAPYPAVVEAFLTLVRWAEPVTTYRHGETTREFLDRVAELLPTHRTTLERLCDDLDTELFSAHGLSTAGRQDFVARVTALTASPSHDAAAGVS